MKIPFGKFKGKDRPSAGMLGAGGMPVADLPGDWDGCRAGHCRSPATSGRAGDSLAAAASGDRAAGSGMRPTESAVFGSAHRTAGERNDLRFPRPLSPKRSGGSAERGPVAD